MNERKALFKGLMSSLVLEEKIKTTEEKAKSIQGQIEKLVTKVKKDTKFSPRLLAKYLSSEAAVKLVSKIASRFVDRPGGYTRIIKLERRFSDNAKIVLIEWVESENQISNIKEQKPELEEDKKESKNKEKKIKKEPKKQGKKIKEKSSKKVAEKKK